MAASDGGTGGGRRDRGGGTTALTVNSSVVAFGGYEWYVIGYNGTGVNSTAGDNVVTLLAKNAVFGSSAFRAEGSAGEQFVKYEIEDPFTGTNTFYYAKNPSGMQEWTTPNEYAGSTLQQRLEAIADAIPSAEQALIAARTLTDGMKGQEIADQRCWALSEEEYMKLNYTVRCYEELSGGAGSQHLGVYWLRTVSSTAGNAALQVDMNRQTVTHIVVSNENNDAVRPALSINGSTILFTSAADSTGKASAGEDGELSALPPLPVRSSTPF